MAESPRTRSRPRGENTPIASTLPLCPPRGVLFDMDGVLVDSEPVHASAYVRVFREEGLALHPDEYRRHVTLDGGLTADLFRAKGGNAALWEAVRARKFTEFRRQIVEETPLLPGVEAVLAAIAARGTPCALVTSSPRYNVETVLDRFDLRRYFAAVVAAEDVRCYKPDPEAYLKALALLDLPAAECVCIEDSPKGLRAATAAGVPCVVVPTAWTRGADFTGARRVVESLAAVTVALLEQVCAETATADPR